MRNESKSTFKLRAEQIIKEKLGDVNLSTKVIAREMQLGRTIFFLQFHMAFGTSPTDYIRIARLEMAAGLLKQSPLPISGVATKVGFRNHAYFAKCFKDYYGLTPTAYQSRK